MTTQVIWQQSNGAEQSNVVMIGIIFLVAFCEMLTRVFHIDTVSMQTDFDVIDFDVIVTVQNVI